MHAVMYSVSEEHNIIICAIIENICASYSCDVQNGMTPMRNSLRELNEIVDIFASSKAELLAFQLHTIFSKLVLVRFFSVYSYRVGSICFRKYFWCGACEGMLSLLIICFFF